MITKDLLDKLLPDTKENFTKACEIINFHTNIENNLICNALLWLAELTERDRFYHPEWTKTDFTSHAYSIETHGLNYKDSMHYLTAQGWPTTSKCWYVRVECGFMEYIASERMGHAVIRAVIIVDLLKKWREIPPSQRKGLIQYLETELNGTSA